MLYGPILLDLKMREYKSQAHCNGTHLYSSLSRLPTTVCVLQNKGVVMALRNMILMTADQNIRTVRIEYCATY